MAKHITDKSKWFIAHDNVKVISSGQCMGRVSTDYELKEVGSEQAMITQIDVLGLEYTPPGVYEEPEN